MRLLFRFDAQTSRMPFALQTLGFTRLMTLILAVVKFCVICLQKASMQAMMIQRKSVHAVCVKYRIVPAGARMKHPVLARNAKEEPKP